MILPPWINKFYILDMQPKNSMIRYLVGQGFTVFVISWKNPDASMDDIDIEDYMDLGALGASDVAREITGSPKVNAMGYCIGGCFAGKLLQRAPDRVVAAVFCQTVGDRPEDPGVMVRHSQDNWLPDFKKRRPEVSDATIEKGPLKPGPKPSASRT